MYTYTLDLSTHVSRNFLYDAINWVSNVLPGGDEQRCDNQDDEGRLVVEPEGVVVDAYRVELDQPLDGAEHVKHGSSGGIL